MDDCKVAETRELLRELEEAQRKLSFVTGKLAALFEVYDDTKTKTDQALKDKQNDA